MASRQQSTKIRAKRIGLSYFKEPHWFRRWKFILSVAAPVVAGLWLLVVAVQGNQRVYNAGPVSTAHAMFEKDCRSVTGRDRPRAARSPRRHLESKLLAERLDRACQTCHAGPRHNSEEAFTPRCATCHVEHFGRARLARSAIATARSATPISRPRTTGPRVPQDHHELRPASRVRRDGARRSGPAQARPPRSEGRGARHRTGEAEPRQASQGESQGHRGSAEEARRAGDRHGQGRCPALVQLLSSA